MLTCQAKSGIRRTARLRSSSAPIMPSMQVRHFWPFNKRTPTDWSSHLDPHYSRFHRQRNLATRAKLLKSIRRLNKWDLGHDRELFFTPRQVRLASHYYGDGNNRRWRREVAEEIDGTKEQEEGDGYELSAREKVWKKQMERMRKRIEVDPYEAVFGKRFQPFWAPLLQNWVRDDVQDTNPQGKTETKANDSVNKPQTSSSEAAGEESPRSTSYAHSSSTSWDSWTNKAKQTEWDSITGETKHYEYDPISNRMVQMLKRQPDAQSTIGTPASPTVTQLQSSSSSVEKAKPATPPQKALRKAIPIPQFEAPPATGTESYTPSEVDGLTAGSIRASMGKPKSQDHHQIAALLQEGSPKKSASSHWDHAEQYCMLEQEIYSLQAKKDALMNEERRASHSGDVVPIYKQLAAKMNAALRKLEAMNDEQIQMAQESLRERTNIKPVLTTALQRGAAASQKVTDAPLRPAVDRMQSKPALDVGDAATPEWSTGTARSIVPKAWTHQADLLQSDRVERTTSKVPYPDTVPQWVHDMVARQEAATNDVAAQERAAKLSKADAILQSEVDRQKLIMQSREERQYEDPLPLQPKRESILEAESQTAKITARYKAKIVAMKQELDLAYQQSSRHADEFRKQIQNRDEIAKALEAKNKAKLAAMKENLDIAYKQSSKHADEFRSQIQRLLDQLKCGNGETRAPAEVTLTGEATPAGKAQADQKLRERALLKEVRDIYEQAYGVIGQEKRQPKSTMEDALAGFDRMTAYNFKKDDLEKELVRPTAPVKEIKHAYAFKKDNLESELKEQDPLVINAETGVYCFRGDNLEAELANKAPEPSKTDLFELDNKSYAFKNDNLEAELVQCTPDSKVTKNNRETLRQRLANEMSDVSKLVNEVKHGRPVSVNPVDGTTAPATGNYASPTGFVNFDPVFPKEETKAERSADPLDHDTEYVRYPRVRREEAVFTGTRRVRPFRREARRDHRRARGSKVRRAFKYFLIGGTLVLGGAYIQGMQMEKTEMKRLGKREAWERIAQGYEKHGERGIVEAIEEMRHVDKKWSSGLFWK